MSIFSEIKDSHHLIVTIAISQFLAPFWYIAIFLFNRDFYDNSDSIIIIVFCSVLSMLPTTMVTILNADKTKPAPATIQIETGKNVTVLILWLSLLIFICYNIQFFCNREIEFYYFLLIFFCCVPLSMINSFVQFLERSSSQLKNK